jgi:hypothetical protein
VKTNDNNGTDRRTRIEAIRDAPTVRSALGQGATHRPLPDGRLTVPGGPGRKAEGGFLSSFPGCKSRSVQCDQEKANAWCGAGRCAEKDFLSTERVSQCREEINPRTP